MLEFEAKNFDRKVGRLALDCAVDNALRQFRLQINERHRSKRQHDQKDLPPQAVGKNKAEQGLLHSNSTTRRHRQRRCGTLAENAAANNHLGVLLVQSRLYPNIEL